MKVSHKRAFSSANANSKAVQMVTDLNANPIANPRGHAGVKWACFASFLIPVIL